MNDPSIPGANDPNWLDEFENFANDQLGDGSDGSACEQIHPVIERWYTRLLEGEPPASRESVLQAMACLSTEIMMDAPEDIVEGLLEIMDEDDLAAWVEYILMVGRAFEASLRSGELDDL